MGRNVTPNQAVQNRVNKSVRNVTKIFEVLEKASSDGAHTNCVDVVADIMIFCKARGVDFNEVLRYASGHATYETTPSNELASEASVEL